MHYYLCRKLLNRQFTISCPYTYTLNAIVKDTTKFQYKIIKTVREKEEKRAKTKATLESEREKKKKRR